MRLGVDFPKEWKLHSEKTGIAMADILYGYAVERFFLRLEKSSFQEYLWLVNEAVLGEEAYSKNPKDRLAFYYKDAGRRVLSKTPEAGNPFGRDMIDLFAEEIFDTPGDDLEWIYYIEETGSVFSINIEAHYQKLRLPMCVTIEEAPANAQSPKSKSLQLQYAGKKMVKYRSYSIESVLAEALFDIAENLELIGDMESYALANDILQNYSINGRHIIEDFKILGDKAPKVVTMKRIQQLEGYATYAYMRKRWEQYEKRHGRKPEEWTMVLERILKFLNPVWNALCDNEIFFDDWMPELGRFLS